ncbi:ribosomal protein L11 methyltransferase [Saccharospirillum sp. MSK14-1]|uniref:50S ribosomal protein L11 methyltransferase n=1 Tax=Saccharospirillum sp. MSK14-1 TaxID=1897632 RepID=UPI000D377386|nr:50S ribosomal protein L11 methyltransferase [Saccharospirillum sp. MSK14-1]PTY37244.1 ribosomal protein L11 methyltransferase [Saccharospirillum sp. MSK14-1]
MPWLQIRIPTDPNHTDAIEEALLLAGCQAVTLIDSEDQPVFEPIRGTTPLWQHTTVQGLFEEDVDAVALQASIEQFAVNEGIQLSGAIHTEILEDKDWERAWMDAFKPIQCGPRLWICPSWLEPPEPTAVNLRLDPGLAFGTGTHPTTFLCLQWLDETIRGGERLLDYGCGSGILGLAAILLGAQQMDGVDIDPQALDATRANAANNGIDNNRFNVWMDDQQLAPTYDLLVANILAGPLCDLAQSLCQRLQRGGRLALSGILSHQAEAVMDAYRPWIDLDAPVERDGWVRLSGTKGASE